MKIDKILFPTKLGELAFNALQSLLILKKCGLKEVILYHVIPREEVGFVPFGGYLKEEEERLREEKQIQFAEWQQALAAAGVKSKGMIDVGDPVPNILAIAEREGVDLMVIGRKKSRPKLSLLGSHTLQLINRSRIPVLVSKHMVEFEWEGETVTRINDQTFSKPLLAVDWTEPADKVAEALMALAPAVERAFVCNILKLHDDLDQAGLQRLEHDSRQRLTQLCERFREEGLEAEPHLGAGQPASEIIRLAREMEASMIIMGTTGKDRLHDLFQGSTSHEVGQCSERPVLLVPMRSE